VELSAFAADRKAVPPESAMPTFWTPVATVLVVPPATWARLTLWFAASVTSPVQRSHVLPSKT
jgi:hypothetical protein